MAVAQHGSSTKHGTNIIGHRQQHKGQEGRDINTLCDLTTRFIDKPQKTKTKYF